MVVEDDTATAGAVKDLCLFRNTSSAPGILHEGKCDALGISRVDGGREGRVVPSCKLIGRVLRMERGSGVDVADDSVEKVEGVVGIGDDCRSVLLCGD